MVPPLAFRQDGRLDPVPVFPHVGDVGHTLIVGPTGAGKSVLLALMALQFRRYPHSQVFAFDFGGSIGPLPSPCVATGTISAATPLVDPTTAKGLSLSYCWHDA